LIEVHAPGKLYIAGEYAVVEPGVPAVLIAVDRCLTVRLTESDGAGRVFSSEYGRMPVVWTRDDDSSGIVIEHQPVDYVMAAIDIIERLATERGLEPHYYDLHIDKYYGLGLSLVERFKLALLATATVSPRSSGGDLAASTFGGWIRYTGPDRAQLLVDLAGGSVTDALASSGWDPFSVTELPSPAGLELLVGWTGSPASTERLVSGVERKSPSSDPRHGDFIVESSNLVDSLVGALLTGDSAAALDILREARGLLQGLGENTGIRIETDKLRTLCEVAERNGAAAKPSGAGGGDCGIVLAPTSADRDAILRDWDAAGIRRLDLAVHAAKGAPKGAENDR
jgi:phosphomevalonate kinase